MHPAVSAPQVAEIEPEIFDVLQPHDNSSES